jgi:glucose-1-phosphate cytidylyltransferase
MKAVILCGGQGTRIRDVSELVPKPMLNIGERPILWHIMKSYAAAGITDFVLCLGYKGWAIKEFFLNYRAMTADCTVELGAPGNLHFHGPGDEAGWRVTLAETGAGTATGGRLVRVRPYLDGSDDSFCLTYGDGVSDLDLKTVVAAHRASGKVATLTAMHMRGRFGEIELDGDSVTRFDEKPAATPGWVNGGFMVLDSEKIWDFLEARDDLVLEQEPLRQLVAAGELGVHRHEGFWQCMDTPREFALLNELWRRGEAPWRVW